MRIGNHTFDTEHRAYLMGIINMTPDSFFDGSRCLTIDEAMFRVESMLKDGVDIIDVGGESTRPGYEVVPEQEEIERVCPVLERIKDYFDVPCSLDTHKSKVAMAGLLSGADMINDIWGLKDDPAMAGIVAAEGAAVCLMHNRQEAKYTDLIEDVLQDLRESIEIAKAAGIDDDLICVDPGIGFAKSQRDNLTVMQHLGRMKELGYPVLLGTSNKSMIGHVLDMPTENRTEGTIATTVYGLTKGVSFFRVHDVAANKYALQMTRAILNGGSEL